MIGQDSDVSLRATPTPEFDAWRWSHYWVPLDAVIHFKREVYFQALNELSVHLFKHRSETRYLRQRHHLAARQRDRKSTRLNSSHVAISYAVFCLKKKKYMVM